MGKAEQGKLIYFQTYTPRITVAKLGAVATMQGISKMRLAGELLAQAVDILWDETFGLKGEGAKKRPSAFDASPGLHDRPKKRKKG